MPDPAVRISNLKSQISNSSPVALARNAMATRFEILLHGPRPIALRAAAEEAFTEIERLDRELSFYHPASQISRLNARAAHEPVTVEPAVFHLLAHAAQLHRETAGAFDITIAPLLRAWGLTGAGGHVPSTAVLAAARRCVGMQHVQLDPDNFTVRFLRPGVQLDLGAIGKGFALERAIQILRDLGVTSALIHGGTSTVCALGHPPDAPAWNIAIEHPENALGQRRSAEHCSASAMEIDPPRPMLGAPSESTASPREEVARRKLTPAPVLAIVPLRDNSLSVSAVWGKSFTAQGRTYGHILDPRTGRPTRRAQLAAVVLPSATESDALSTALLTLGAPGLQQLVALRPDIQALVVAEGSTGKPVRLATHGLAPFLT